MNLPIDLLKFIVMYIKNTEDIFNLRLTNKTFYSINKIIPIYKNNTKLYEIFLKNDKIIWIQCNSNKIVKEIIFTPYGGIRVNNYNNKIINASDNNYDYKFNLPYNFIKIKKNKNFRIKQTYDIINNNNKTEMIPVYFSGCQLS